MQPTHNLTHDQLHCTWNTAVRYGGSFVINLAAAWGAADPSNRLRIEAAFPEVLDKYGPSSNFYNHPAPTEDDLKAEAVERYESDNIQVDEDPTFDYSLDGGVWVSANVWVAVPNPSDEL